MPWLKQEPILTEVLQTQSRGVRNETMMSTYCNCDFLTLKLHHANGTAVQECMQYFKPNLNFRSPDGQYTLHVL